MYQLGVLLDSLRNRAEDNALFGERITERSLNRNRVHNGIDSDTCKGHLLLERNAELVECTLELGVYLVHRVELGATLGCCVIDDILKINLGDIEVCPVGVLEGQPMAESLETTL